MSESSNNPQPFDVVLGGNNPPKNKSTEKKVEKPKLKKKADSTDNKSKASSTTKIKQSSNTNHAENISTSKSSTEDKTESTESQSSSETSEKGCCETGCGCLILLMIIAGIAQFFI